MGSGVEVKPVKMLAIKTKDRVYLSDNIDGKGYYNDNMMNSLLFDGVKAERTYKSDWYSIAKWPDKVEKSVVGGRNNYRWRLKAGYPVGTLTPEVLTINPNMEDSEYSQVAGLYTQESDQLPDTVEEVVIEWNIIAELPEFTIKRPKYTVKNNLIDEITTHPVMLSGKPCSVGGPYLYQLIRSHIKQNIDNRYARVTSDYDFSFEVKKALKYAIPVKYQTEEGTGRKKHSVTKYMTTKEESVLKMGDGTKGYGSYPEPIQAANYQELELKMEQYLKELMEVINEPLVECPHCNGVGAIIEKPAT